MRTPGALCAAAVLSPIPAETGQRYPKTSPLTVLLRPQVHNSSVTRLWLILVGGEVKAPDGKEANASASTSDHQRISQMCRWLTLRIAQHS